MKKVCLKIDGMTCSACSSGLEKYLNKQEKVQDAVVNLIIGEATIHYDDDLTIKELEEYIQDAGFISLGEATKLDVEKSTKRDRNTLIILGIVLILLMYLSMGHMFHLPIILNPQNNPKLYVSMMFLLIIPFLLYSRDIFKSGFKNLKHRMPNMDSLVSIGVVASLLISIINMLKILSGNIKLVENLYFESVAMILFFVKLGRFLDKNSKAKTVEAIEELVQITPEKALLKVDDFEKEVTIDEIKVDDILIAKPGMKIAVDGVILKGSTHLDETFITGESVLVKKKKGDSVIAGSLNYDGLIEYQAKKIGRNSTISEIVHLVVDATNTKAPITKQADRISSYFVPVLLSIAVITFFVYLLLGSSIYEAFETFVTTLVVACPCALGLATPLAIVIATGYSAKYGILVKSSEILENVSKVDVVLFDKTGTLTKGKLEIAEVVSKNTDNEKELLKVVASIENLSTHPIRYAFLKYAKDQNIKLLKVDAFNNLEGIGVMAIVNNNTYYLGNHKLFSKLDIANPYNKEEQRLKKLGNSIVYIIQNNEVIALIGVKDRIREESKEVVSNLKRMGKNVVMLTGDNQEVASIVANEIGIKEFQADVMPKDKREYINQLKIKGKKVMMIGDGINDAPSLALADIGVSVANATDIATNTADVILLRLDLTSILDLVIISKKTLKNIQENLFWAFFYNACMIPIAIGFLKPFGIGINPMIASATMTLSSLTVVFNALRLRKIKLTK